MIVRRSLGLTLGTLFILASAQGAWAATATEQLKSAIDRVLATVDNPALKGDGKIPERRLAVRKIANDIVDFREVALRSPRAAAGSTTTAQAPRVDMTKATSLVKEAEAACKAGNMTLASDKAKAALAILK